MSTQLNEDSRRDLITKSRLGSKQRYQKRLNYQVPMFRGVKLSEFWFNDYFVFETHINDYIVNIAFPGVLTELKKVVKPTNGDATKINYQMVVKALRIAFDKTDDVKVRCSCADFKFRFMYWANKYGYLYGPPEKGTEEFPEVRNPNDDLGATCKHLNLFLSNKTWLQKAAYSVVSIIKTYPEKAALYLYDEEDIKQDDVVEEEPIESEETVEEIPTTEEEQDIETDVEENEEPTDEEIENDENEEEE